jgi:long-chain acyl-CoA synthetase
VNQGNPKGVMISHGNILIITKALMKRIGSVRPDEHTYIGYLPLAHVLELVCEFTYLINGIKIGYASAQTIMDTSLGVKPGEWGDLRTLNPSLMSAVPLVYDF